MTNFFRLISRKMPGLGLKLKQAEMKLTPEKFVKQTFVGAIYITLGLLLVLAAFFARSTYLIPVLLIFGPLVLLFSFLYVLRVPDAKAHRIMTNVNCEVVDAGRFLVVEIESGVPLYDSLVGVQKNFDRIGKYFRKITVSIDNGTPVEEAIQEVLEYTPSRELRRLLWQIVNSLKTGSDVAGGMKEVIEQISREHLIEMKRYGRKLNPLSMFYMIIAVIVPSLGVAMLVVFSSLLSLQIDFLTLMILAAGLGFLQFMFLAIVRSSRPAINL